MKYKSEYQRLHPDHATNPNIDNIVDPKILQNLLAQARKPNEIAGYPSRVDLLEGIEKALQAHPDLMKEFLWDMIHYGRFPQIDWRTRGIDEHFEPAPVPNQYRGMLDPDMVADIETLRTLQDDFEEIAKDYIAGDAYAYLEQKTENLEFGTEVDGDLEAAKEHMLQEMESNPEFDVSDFKYTLRDNIKEAIDVFSDINQELRQENAKSENKYKLHDEIDQYIKVKFQEAGFEVSPADSIKSHWNILTPEGEHIGKMRIKDHAYAVGSGSIHGHGSPDFEFDYSGRDLGSDYDGLMKDLIDFVDESIDESQEIKDAMSEPEEFPSAVKVEPSPDPDKPKSVPNRPLPDDYIPVVTFDDNETEARFQAAMKGLIPQTWFEKGEGLHRGGLHEDDPALRAYRHGFGDAVPESRREEQGRGANTTPSWSSGCDTLKCQGTPC